MKNKITLLILLVISFSYFSYMHVDAYSNTVTSGEIEHIQENLYLDTTISYTPEGESLSKEYMITVKARNYNSEDEFESFEVGGTYTIISSGQCPSSIVATRNNQFYNSKKLIFDSISDNGKRICVWPFINVTFYDAGGQGMGGEGGVVSSPIISGLIEEIKIEKPTPTSTKTIHTATPEVEMIENTSTPTPTFTVTPTTKFIETDEVALSQLAKSYLTTKINNSRNENNLDDYFVLESLESMSLLHSTEMAESNILQHTSRDILKTRGRDACPECIAMSENIGVAKNVKMTEEGIVNAIDKIHIMMINEVAPNDGHKQAILSKNNKYIGVGVTIVDQQNEYATIYITETFAR